MLIKKERCKIWKNKNKNLLCWQGLVLLDWSWQVWTCPNHDFWSNLARFGTKNGISTKFIDDSATFLLEKLTNHYIFTKRKCGFEVNQIWWTVEMSGPAKASPGGQVLVSKAGFYLFSQKLHISFLFANSLIYSKIIFLI